MKSFVPQSFRKTTSASDPLHLHRPCPNCGAVDHRKKTGMLYDPVKEIAKCFHCGFGAGSAVTWLM
jgi:hypothetical protein